MYYTQEQIDRANQADLVSFLQSQGEQLTSGTDQSEGSGDEPKKQGWFSRLFRG